jgi:hypothetical protein
MYHYSHRAFIGRLGLYLLRRESNGRLQSCGVLADELFFTEFFGGWFCAPNRD